ncbi:MAG: Stk1 family PASTA domain-containing Ser/Thr kinase [Candidatus Nanopelagicales bacterium]|nr:Stk1 family PASTA domain-containing Ser/Thr kinase [Candidatus Nanopelagicales bacterium]
MTPSPPPPPTAVDPLVGRVLDGRYRIESFIARGGMATIYRGADLRLDRTVAIKVMHPTFATDPGFVDRFEREARAAARLNSPYAVAVHDQGNDAGVTYLVMEYVPGHTVRDVLRTHGALPPAQALAIIDPVLQALAAAHRAGYIHRDVKPENVLISEDGRVKVTDFGLARAIEGADSGKTHGLLLGTVAYLSPEQVEHDHTDARSDVYSAGILLFELVTGQVPFSASAPMQVAYRHVHEDVPAPSTIAASTPAGIDALVQRATRRDPGQRFGDADAFLSAVRVQKDQLPPAEAWAPAPNDTLVVNRGAGPAAAAAAAGAAGAAAAAGAGAGHLDAPEWVNQRPDDAPPAPGTPAPIPAPAPGPPNQAPATDQTQATQVSHQTAPDAPSRPRRGRGAIWLGVVALLSIVAVVAVVLLQRVTVPDVLGKTPTDAAAVLATYNLTLASDEEAFSEEYPKGEIMSTDPGPGSATRSGSTVQAVVSKGPERYDVPKLRKLTVEEAQVALGAANLELGEQTEAFDDNVKKDDIISSDPPAGESVKPGTTVAVVVSKGPEPVTMPTLVGTDGDAAEAALKDLGLEVDRSTKTSESVAKGLVISTNPAGGATTFRGETVELVVSKGPPLVTVPNVVGRSESEARAALEDAGFAVNVNKPLGFVVFGVNSQNPRGGTKAPKGSTVTITVV